MNLRPLKEKFEAKVLRTNTCWLWTAATRPDGYGVMGLGGRGGGTGRAHRVSWTLYKGKIPFGMLVLHKCENRRCVRPSHLKLGTQLQNIQDSFKDRSFPLGTRNGQSKLTIRDVRKIREAYRPGVRGNAIALAKEFHIHRVHVTRLARKVSWTHVGNLK